MRARYRLTLLAVAAILLLPAASRAQQVGPPFFPQTLPTNTVVGRVQAGTGPASAIPFAQLGPLLGLTTTLNVGSTPIVGGSNTQCLTINGSVLGSGTCGSPTAVTSVSNSDGTLTVSPNTGAVSASLALNHANTWNNVQTFTSNALVLGGVTGSTQCLHANASGVVSGTGSDCSAGGGGTPGGSSKQFQFNSASTFAGANVWRTTADQTDFSDGVTAQAVRNYNTTDTNGGTPTNAEWSMWDWTTSANVLTIGTSSSGTGAGRDFQIFTGGAKRIYVGGLSNGVVSTTTLDANGGFSVAANGAFFSTPGASVGWNGEGQFLGLASGYFGFDSSTTDGRNVADTAWFRDAGVGLMALGDKNSSTTATGLRVYNTTDNVATNTAPTNYERAAFDWTTVANTLTIGTQKGGTGSVRNLEFVVGGTNELDFGITNAGLWTIPAAAGLEFGTTGKITSGIGVGVIGNSGGLVTDIANWGGGILQQRFGNAGALAWDSAASPDNNTSDLAIYRDAAVGVLAVVDNQTATTATGFRVYNTTDHGAGSNTAPTNYERAAFDWTTTANVLTIGPQAGGTKAPLTRYMQQTTGFASQPPTTKTANYSQTVSDQWLIFNCSGSCTLTLLSAATYPGLSLYVRTIAAQTVVSASSNVVPRAGGAAGTAILAGAAGNWALLVSDGTNWQNMAGTP